MITETWFYSVHCTRQKIAVERDTFQVNVFNRNHTTKLAQVGSNDLACHSYMTVDPVSLRSWDGERRVIAGPGLQSPRAKRRDVFGELREE